MRMPRVHAVEKMLASPQRQWAWDQAFFRVALDNVNKLGTIPGVTNPHAYGFPMGEKLEKVWKKIQPLNQTLNQEWQ